MRTNLRVGAIIFHRGKLIATRMKKWDSSYYVLPGGGVEENENMYEALKRELMEELNIEVIKFRLVYIRELNMKDRGRGVELYFYVEKFNGEPKKGFDPEKKESSFEEIALLELGDLNKIVFHPAQLVNILKDDLEKDFGEIKHLGLYDYP